MRSPASGAPPVGAGETQAQDTASLLRRFAALSYEALIYAALALMAGFLTLPLMAPATSGAYGLRIPDLPTKLLSFAVVFGVGALFYTWSWTGGRRTLPMKTWRLRLLRADGTVLDRRTALLRYFGAWIGPVLALVAYVGLRNSDIGIYALSLLAVNYLWVFVDADRRFLHDRIAGTRIVGDAPIGRSGIPSPLISANRN